jgi:hypothetical protein
MVARRQECRVGNMVFRSRHLALVHLERPDISVGKTRTIHTKMLAFYILVEQGLVVKYSYQPVVIHLFYTCRYSSCCMIVISQL